MRLTAIFLLAGCLTVSAKGVSQKVTLSEKDAPLEKVFREIESQTGFSFLYENSLMQKAKKVSITVNDKPLSEVLEECMRNQPLSYKIFEKTVVIAEKPTPALQSGVTSPSDLLKDFFPPPPIDIHGRITDPEGEPLVGATIRVKGTNNTTETDGDGRFSLKGVDESASIEVSYVGFVMQTIPVSKRTNILVALKRNDSPLDDVQVIAYGQTTQRLNVGNVTTVKGEDIEKQPVNNPLLALEGRVPGLFITQTNGLSNGGVTVRVQGQNSIRSGNDPLYVIDGVPFYSQLPSTGFDFVLGTSGNGALGPTGNGNPLSLINPSDIESIEVLKDASATAIYGSRAANGAILITTKKGKAGAFKVSLNLQNGWGTVPQMLDMLNRQQYLQMRNEALKNDNLIASANPSASGSFKYAPDLMIWDTTKTTDWQKALIGGTAQYTNLNASISGGNVTTQYLLGATYHKETTVFPGDFNDQKTSLHFNINIQSPNRKFKLQFSGSYMVDNNKLPQNDFTSYIALAPNAPNPYNPDGSLNWALNSAGSSTWDNPYKLLYTFYRNKTDNLISNAVISYEVLPGLILKSSLGYVNTQTSDYLPSPLVFIAPESQASTGRKAGYGSRNLDSWIIEPTLNYHRSLWLGQLELLAGATIQQNNTLIQYLQGSGYPSDLLLENIHAATTVASGQSTIAQYKYNAIYGRLNYRLKDRYIVELSARRDGSSRFGPESQFHDFWSMGGAWIFSEERIVKNLPILSFGKFNASYGITGNDQIGDYQFLNLYNPTATFPFPYQGMLGLATNSLFNPNLQWEETHKLSFGVDIGLFKNRILFNAVYASNQSSNQLFSYTLPSTTGTPSIITNFPATIRNTSLEFLLTTANIKGSHFSWNTTINFTIPRNKLIEFAGLASSPYATIYKIGQPLALTQLYNFAGVNPLTGISAFIDYLGNATTSPSFSTDKYIWTTTYPKFYAGLGNTISYKGLQLDFLFQFTARNALNNLFTTLNVPGTYYYSAANGGNQLTTVLSRWQKPGDITSIQKYNSTGSLSNIANLSQAGISDAFFCRLKNMSLSWQLPTKWQHNLNMKNIRIYAQGQNLLTISKFIGLDPETLSIGSLPPLKVLTLGIQAEF